MKKQAIRWTIIILVICLVIGIAAWLLLRDKNELFQVSKAKEVPCEGVSLAVTATKRDVEITITNTDMMNYIVWEPNHMDLEMLMDGTWYTVKQEYRWRGPTGALSPVDEVCILNYSWKDIFPRNLNKGEYRLVFTFWAMTENEEGVLKQSENFVIIEEFTIN